jgi:hypothetical protein
LGERLRNARPSGIDLADVTLKMIRKDRKFQVSKVERTEASSHRAFERENPSAHFAAGRLAQESDRCHSF